MRLRHLLPALLIALVSTASASSSCPGLLDRSYRLLAKREPVKLCEQFAGEVLLVVNTASKCGFTPQYEGLEALHQDLHSRGFSVIGFPSNDFMGQEPGSEEQIAEFCTLTYGVKFPMFEKLIVTGEKADPLYREMAEQGGGAPGWNFHKYLIGRDGHVIAGFGSRTKPDSAELRKAIETALAAPRPQPAR